MKDAIPLTDEEIKNFFQRIDSNWIFNENKLEKEFRFKDFNEALCFANKIGIIAESEDHHPDLEIGFGRLTVLLYTHSVNSLTIKDFILAEKINEISL